MLPPRPPLHRNLGPISKPSGYCQVDACVCTPNQTRFRVPECSGGVRPLHGAAAIACCLRSSCSSPIASLSLAAPTAAAHRTRGCDRGSLRTTPVAPQLRPSGTSRTWRAGQPSPRCCLASPVGSSIVAADIVEVLPLPGQIITELLAARLAYKIISYAQIGS